MLEKVELLHESGLLTFLAEGVGLGVPLVFSMKDHWGKRALPLIKLIQIIYYNTLQEQYEVLFIILKNSQNLFKRLNRHPSLLSQGASSRPSVTSIAWLLKMHDHKGSHDVDGELAPPRLRTEGRIPTTRRDLVTENKQICSPNTIFARRTRIEAQILKFHRESPSSRLNATSSMAGTLVQPMMRWTSRDKTFVVAQREPGRKVLILGPREAQQKCRLLY